MSEQAYTITPRPDSGLTNPALGLWLFLGSEIMLFGSLFSAYALIRLGAEQWPAADERWHFALGALGLLALVLSCIAAYSAWESARRGSPRSRVLLVVTMTLGALSLALRGAEYHRAIDLGFVPSLDVSSAIFFALTGVSALHLLGGMVVFAFLAGPGFRDLSGRPALFAQRVELTAVYWHFIALVCLVLFPFLYLV